MIAISELIKNRICSPETINLQEEIKEKEKILRQYKSSVSMSYDDFNQLFRIIAYNLMLRRSISREFEIDGQNEPVIAQLYLYFMNDPSCEWNLNAGLLFAGKIGCGKSLLMMAFLNICNDYCRRQTRIVHSKSLANLIKKDGLEYYEKSPLMIDELGREESEVKDWGNVVKPVIDLFSLRYEAGARTYATTNFNYTSLENYYGEFIRTRMEEMMTYVVIPGESRRLKNEVKK